MLVPKWGLATGRRGIKSLGEREFNAIFDSPAQEAFNLLKADWSSRMNAPFKRARRLASKLNSAENWDDQADLFQG